MIEVEEKNMYVGGIYRIADEKNPYYCYRFEGTCKIMQGVNV